jgi:hypothetical protein
MSINSVNEIASRYEVEESEVIRYLDGLDYFSSDEEFHPAKMFRDSNDILIQEFLKKHEVILLEPDERIAQATERSEVIKCNPSPQHYLDRESVNINERFGWLIKLDKGKKLTLSKKGVRNFIGKGNRLSCAKVSRGDSASTKRRKARASSRIMSAGSMA